MTGPGAVLARTSLVAGAALVLVACAAPSAPGGPSGPASSTVAPAPTVPGATSAPSATASGTVDPPTASSTATALHVTADAVVRPVRESQWRRIVAVGAWHPGCPVGRAQLRRVEVSYHGFDGTVHRGVLVVNADVAAGVAGIMTRLFDEGFPIHRMRPIEDYGGDDDASMAADNTSAYNCRRAGQANAPAAVSPHANGRAIDLNPYENPWVDPRCGCFRPDARYGTRRSGTGVVVKGGVAWAAFTRAGWIWQDSATPDFQHFDTGYPSRPLP